MKSLWNDNEAKTFANDPLQLRVYTSRLLGQEPELVLHGGGNTSLKANVKNLFGDKEKILFLAEGVSAFELHLFFKDDCCLCRIMQNNKPEIPG